MLSTMHNDMDFMYKGYPYVHALNGSYMLSGFLIVDTDERVLIHTCMGAYDGSKANLVFFDSFDKMFEESLKIRKEA